MLIDIIQIHFAEYALHLLIRNSVHKIRYDFSIRVIDTREQLRHLSPRHNGPVDTLRTRRERGDIRSGMDGFL